MLLPWEVEHQPFLPMSLCFPCQEYFDDLHQHQQDPRSRCRRPPYTAITPILQRLLPYESAHGTNDSDGEDISGGEEDNNAQEIDDVLARNLEQLASSFKEAMLQARRAPQRRNKDTDAHHAQTQQAGPSQSQQTPSSASTGSAIRTSKNTGAHGQTIHRKQDATASATLGHDSSDPRLAHDPLSPEERMRNIFHPFSSFEEWEFGSVLHSLNLSESQINQLLKTQYVRAKCGLGGCAIAYLPTLVFCSATIVQVG
jgi:hypothetical protein